MKKILIVFLIAFLGAQTAFAAAPAWITVDENARVKGPDILLGDIAQISCEDAARAGALARLKIGNAAAPGGKVSFSERLLRLRLTAAGGDLEGVVWEIPPLIVVETNAAAISGEKFKALVADYIEEQMNLEKDGRKFTVEVLSDPADLLAPDGKISYEIELPYGIKDNAPTNVAVSVHADGRFYKKVLMRARVHAYEPVVVTNRSLASKETVGEADVRLEYLDTGRLAPGYLTELNQAVGMVVKRVVNKGVPLTAHMIDRPILIKRMATVDIVSSVGGARVKTEGVALQDGRADDLIRVRNVKSGKSVSGRVVDDSTVEVS